MKDKNILSKLIQTNTEQEEIITKQAEIIDKLFTLLCQYVNLESVEDLESLFVNNEI